MGVALVRIIRATSPRAVAAGIKPDILSGSPTTVLHVDPPFVLYSIWFVTPVTTSSRRSRSRPTGASALEPGKGTVLSSDIGVAAVAAVRTRSDVAEPKMLRGIAAPGQRVQVAPSSRLYSLVVETPVIVSVVALYTALGAAGRAGTVTVSVADAGKVVGEAATRI